MNPTTKLICSVYFEDERGARMAGHTTQAGTLFEAVRNAWKWYQDRSWQGPRPTLDTVFTVTVSSRPEKFYVLARRALEIKQPSLFEQAAVEAFDPR